MAEVKRTKAEIEREKVLEDKIGVLAKKINRKNRREAVAFFDMPIDEWTEDENMVFTCWLIDPSKGFEFYNELPFTEMEDLIYNS